MSARTHLRYAQRLLAHKWFVFVAGRIVGAPLWRLLIHDWSKFRPSEWCAYAENFCGEPVENVALAHWRQHAGTAPPTPNDVGYEAVRAAAQQLQAARRGAFAYAWLRHKHRNAHHWEHWVQYTPKKTIALAMPDAVIREMVADWAGAGRAYTGQWDVAEWYSKNADRMLLHPRTRFRVECLVAEHFGWRA